jgi:1-deoxy-D-xylulose 5-phosphate reductoisomerase
MIEEIMSEIKKIVLAYSGGLIRPSSIQVKKTTTIARSSLFPQMWDRGMSWTVGGKRH